MSATNANMEAFKGAGAATIPSTKTSTISSGTITIKETTASSKDVVIANAGGNISMVGNIEIANAA